MTESNQVSIAEQMTDLFNPKPPEEFNPENDFIELQGNRPKPHNIHPIEETDLNQRRILPEIPINPKFAVKKTTLKELAEIQEKEDESEESESVEKNEEKVDKNEDVNENENEKEIEAALGEIQQEDKEQETIIKKSKEVNEMKKGKQVVAQRKLLDSFLGIRILLQKFLTIANKLPQSDTYPLFQNTNPQITEKYQEAINNTKKFIETTLSIQSTISQESEISTKIPAITVEGSTWTAIKANKESIKDNLYDVIENWMNKTQLYVNAKLKNSMKTLGAHPLRQAEEKYRKNKEKILRKAQMKSKPYRILGKPADSIKETLDKEVYEDAEHYQTLLKDYLVLNAKNTGGNEKNTGDGEELDMTYKYLQSKGIDIKRQKIGVPDKERKKRKNRALKYVVHEKLVNFLAQQDNPGLLPGYENIVKSLFGMNSGEPEEVSPRKRARTLELEEAMEKEEAPEDENNVKLI